ncbi:MULTISPECIES: hypothetical protein [unclassified Streptococcus]|uniref:hypothetical protein n=1 Tax=unclassified Streptococcus TaxID=2608887 RepID=UPI0010728F40|nr:MULTISPECIES: hypothetical protein [unclassified Streptococcus]MBF0787605.1 hypothetical protein [Streptococcus sp. 19428wC2_LYSM12]MCQ9211992.1 hypothetical protein [Streptococcus sp. B01]MCQ9213321.1 hypothetical protein [Streptococcus sp. O1]TFV05446.1 hypothetical protein E4T79_06820 [Streptococcus sp. LYSM12]
MLSKLQKSIYCILQGTIGYGARLLFLPLVVATLVFQAVIYLPYKEWVGLSFSGVWTALSVLLVCFVGWLLSKFRRTLSCRQLFILLSALYVLAGFVLLFSLPAQLRDDAASVWRAASLLNKGDTRFLQAGAYLNRYPHQLGLVSLERIVLFVLPRASVRIFYFLNLLAILGINYANWKLSEELFGKERVSWYTILALFAFLPQFFNMFFVYGLVYGLCAASFGLLYFYRYLQEQHLQSALLASLFLSLSYWIRNNNSILLVAVAVILLLECLRRRKPLLLGLLLPLLIGSLGLNKATVYYYERMGQVHFAPNPKITWLAMGLQDTQTELRQGGWYNKYVRQVYDRYEGDEEKITQAAKLEITNRVQDFVETPSYAGRFFLKKFVTTWTESTFQSIWSGPSKLQQRPLKGEGIESLYHGGLVYRLFYHYTHAYLILLYGGALVFLMVASPWKRLPIEYYAYVYWAGGVLFHLLWETKSQYVYPYVFVMLPFAVKGYQEVWEWWLKNSRKG